MPFHRWLEMIFKDEETPSLNELGLNYPKYLRYTYKRMSRRERAAWDSIPESQQKFNKIKYELNNMAKLVMRMMQAQSSPAPYMLLGILLGKVEYSFVSFSRLTKLIEELKQIDFSVFYRETVYHASNTSTEIINTEVEPYFILLPICGNKVVFWQEFSNGKKSSRGRIFVPAFFIGDLRASMIKALGDFRWELCRSSKGALWTDPVEGGVSGQFYDYITFYKKTVSSLLPPKKNYTKPSKTFARSPEGYLSIFTVSWIESESKGVMKLDKACTCEMFFKHLPFSRPIRDALKRIPIYADLINKYDNVTMRNINRLEIRYKNRVDENGELPKVLKDNLAFYKY